METMSSAHDNDLVHMMQECVADSINWFGHQPFNLGNMGLCLAGEAGEFCNILKKISRGSLPGPFEDTLESKNVRLDLIMEATDTLIYLMNIFGLLGADPKASYDHKRAINQERFGAHASE